MADGQWEGGQPKATWYDKYGRSYPNLPADETYSVPHYQGRGLSRTPPESPVPVPVDNGFGEGSANATRQKSSPKPEQSEQPDIQMLLNRIAVLETARKRGPDKKKRKRRRKRTPS